MASIDFCDPLALFLWRFVLSFCFRVHCLAALMCSFNLALSPLLVDDLFCPKFNGTPGWALPWFTCRHFLHHGQLPNPSLSCSNKNNENKWAFVVAITGFQRLCANNWLYVFVGSLSVLYVKIYTDMYIIHKCDLKKDLNWKFLCNFKNTYTSCVSTSPHPG